VVFSFPPIPTKPFPCSFPFPWNYSSISLSHRIPVGSTGPTGIPDVDSSLTITITAQFINQVVNIDSIQV